MQSHIFSRFVRLIPPIRVHVWGGFGSQIFALLACRRLLKHYPFRKIKIVFHSSGVTERLSELPSQFLKDFRSVQKHDFQVQIKQTTNLNAVKPLPKVPTIVKTLLKQFGFLSEIESEGEFSNLRWWILATRGHYTNYTLQFEELNYLLEILNLRNSSESIQGVSIHFRLGDLTNLKSKRYIPVERLKNALLLVKNSIYLRIYSDSNPETVSGIWGMDNGRCIFFHSEDPIATIRKCVLSEEFIGTNSKLSIIIALCRVHLRKSGHTILPNEIINQFKTNGSQMNQAYKVKSF